MEIDGPAAGSGKQSLTSLIAVYGVMNLKRRHPNRKVHGNHPGKRPGRQGAPQRPAPLGDLTPTRSFTRQVKVESLRVYEGAGHTLERHVNNVPNADVDRLNRERVPASGSFFNEEIAQRSVEAAVEAHKGEIGNWLNNQRAKGTFVRDLDMGEPIGSVLTRADLNAAVAAGRTPQATPAGTVRIVLRKSEKFEGGFFVLTSYPVPDNTAGVTAPEMRIAPLAAYEGPGHTLGHHVGLSGADLVERLTSNDQITAASVFADLGTAQSAVQDAVAARASEIHNWLLSGMEQPFSGSVTLGRPVGVVLTRDAFERGRRQPAPANRVHFVLGRSEAHPGGFFVKTAYPVLPY